MITLKNITTLVVLIISSGLMYSQSDSVGIQGTVKSDTVLPPIYTYYAKYGLHPDSASSIVLYNQVYEWTGTKYKYAGHDKSGIDCSGFVCAMYDTAYHIKLAGSALSLYSQVDTVPRDSLREGDILFFKIRKGQISHVGVYLGKDKFAHASVHNGVILSDLKEAYYKKYFFVGGRLKGRDSQRD